MSIEERGRYHAGIMNGFIHVTIGDDITTLVQAFEQWLNHTITIDQLELFAEADTDFRQVYVAGVPFLDAVNGRITIKSILDCFVDAENCEIVVGQNASLRQQRRHGELLEPHKALAEVHVFGFQSGDDGRTSSVLQPLMFPE